MEINKKRILQGIAVGVIGTLTIGGLAGCVSEDPEGTFYTQDQIDTMITDAKAEVKCSPCECKTEILECPVSECEVCEICIGQAPVEVDNGNMDAVLKYLLVEDNRNESFGVITEDLDEDDKDKLVDRIVFANDLKISAEQLVKAEGLKFLDDDAKHIFGNINDSANYRDSDVYYFDVKEDKTVISEIHDFDEKEADLTVEVRMKLKDGDYRDKVNVIFKVESNEDELKIIGADLE